MPRPPTLDEVVSSLRTGAAALAVAVALLLLFKVPLIATFRAALVALAALELLAFGRRALAANARVRDWLEAALKLAVLTAAYLALGQ